MNPPMSRSVSPTWMASGDVGGAAACPEFWGSAEWATARSPTAAVDAGPSRSGDCAETTVRGKPQDTRPANRHCANNRREGRGRSVMHPLHLYEPLPTRVGRYVVRVSAELRKGYVYVNSKQPGWRLFCYFMTPIKTRTSSSTRISTIASSRNCPLDIDDCSTANR